MYHFSHESPRSVGQRPCNAPRAEPVPTTSATASAVDLIKTMNILERLDLTVKGYDFVAVGRADDQYVVARYCCKNYAREFEKPRWRFEQWEIISPILDSLDSAVQVANEYVETHGDRSERLALSLKVVKV